VSRKLRSCGEVIVNDGIQWDAARVRNIQAFTNLWKRDQLRQ
jgi:hypothetical protein